MTGRNNGEKKNEDDGGDDDFEDDSDNFDEEDILDDESGGYEDEEPRKTTWRKEQEGDMTRKEAKDYPKVGEYLRENPDTVKQIAQKTGIPEDFMETVGPDLGNFLAKYLYMVMGGKGKAMDPEKMKWFKDLKNDLEPLVKAFYKYFVKKQASKMGLTDEDLANLQQIQQEQGTDAAMAFLKEKVDTAQGRAPIADPQLPPEWQSQDGKTVVQDDRQVPLNPQAEPPERFQRRPGLPGIEELAQRAGVSPDKLAPRGDAHVQKTVPITTDTDNIIAMMQQEREKIKSGDLYSQRKPSDYNLPQNTGGEDGLTLAGAGEVMEALKQDTERMKMDGEKRIQERQSKQETLQQPYSQTRRVQPVLPEPVDVMGLNAPDLKESDILEPNVTEDFPSLTKLKKMKRPELDVWARKAGVDPTPFNNKWDLLEAMTKALEGGS